MGALLDDSACTVLRCQAPQVGQALLGDHAVEVVLSVVDVRAVRHNAGYAVRIGFAWTAGRSMHHFQIAVAKEVAGTAETVDHTGTADQC